jgi:Circularly permutated YpsA SLOG family
MTVRKIISGGQTGADMGALIAARELGIESGGVAPRGWLTENGPQEELLRGFGLTECDEGGYEARTRRNAAVSDGTLLVGPHTSGGSGLTHDTVRQLAKPLFLLPFEKTLNIQPEANRLGEFRSWLKDHEILTLNVAGNRESQSPGIADFTREFLIQALAVQRSAE